MNKPKKVAKADRERYDYNPTEIPPLSDRCRYWINQTRINGFTPNARIRGAGRDGAADILGVYVAEYCDVLTPMWDRITESQQKYCYSYDLLTRPRNLTVKQISRDPIVMLATWELPYVADGITGYEVAWRTFPRGDPRWTTYTVDPGTTQTEITNLEYDVTYQFEVRSTYTPNN